MIMGEKRERKVIRIISGGEAAKKYKCLQTEKYNERNYDQKRHLLQSGTNIVI